MARRIALLVGTSDYTADPGLRQLVAPPQDAQRLAHLLEDPAIGGFEVRVLPNQPTAVIREAVEETLVDCDRDDLALLYFSGHGVKDFHDGHLYLAFTNTRLKLLESTAIPADFINRVMLRSRSRQQVLILDCCYSGAFARGMTVKAVDAIHTAEYFPGQGRAVITASDAMQYALEGETPTGEGVQSVFTRILADGLESGAADLNGDGQVELEELYEYLLQRMRDESPSQKPTKVFALSGKLYLARSPQPPMAKPAALPSEALDEVLTAVTGMDLPLLPDAAEGKFKDILVRSLEQQLKDPSRRPATQRTTPMKWTSASPDRLQITTPLEMELVRIPAGEFRMGSGRAVEGLAYDDELPQHEVYVAEFYMARTPVTVAQFTAFAKADGYTTQAEGETYGQVWKRKRGVDATWEHKKGANWRHPRGPRSSVARKPDHPVTQVSWQDARAFTAWLNRAASGAVVAGSQFSLPTEAEWEKAARSTDGRNWPWGNTWDATKCNCGDQSGATTPVSKFSPAGDSPYGCVDMVGNVWEWTVSLWGKNVEEPDHKYPYNASDGRENMNAAMDVRRVLRGGSFLDSYWDARCACRNRALPYLRNDSIGFRVVLRGVFRG